MVDAVDLLERELATLATEWRGLVAVLAQLDAPPTSPEEMNS